MQLFRGEYTKTRVDRFVFLTREVQDQIKIWLDYKCRKRRICYKDKETEKSITEYITPEKKPNELIFSFKSYTDLQLYSMLYHG